MSAAGRLAAGSVAAHSRRLGRRVPGAGVQIQVLGRCPEIRLLLIDPDYPQEQLEPAQVLRLMDEPPYWAFCWASGQVLARYLLDHPEQVRGRRVLDVGAGSGVVAIAAALAGALEVVACDLDPEARAVMRTNAALNGVALRIVDAVPEAGHFDLTTLADVLYDRENLPLLTQLGTLTRRVLLADSRLRDPAVPGYRLLGQFLSRTWPDLDESEEFNRVRLYLGIPAELDGDA